MPLYFTEKKKHWPPPKPVQYILAVVALLLAVGILMVWLRVFKDSNVTPSSDPTTTTTSSQIKKELPDNGYFLLIIEDAEYERFALIELSPNTDSITVQPISPTMSLNNNETVVQVYRRAKAGQVTQVLASHYQLPLEHYVSLTISELEALISRWGGSLTLTPPEEITYRDENGAAVRLPAEANALTPKQIAAMLHHRQWNNAQNDLQLSADLTVAILNHLLTSSRDLNKVYNAIADHTSIRVHHFQAFYDGLIHLAACNDGLLAENGIISNP